MMLGAGEGRALVNGSEPTRSVKAKTRFDVFAHALSAKRQRPRLKGW
jgi:hypothetical protein